jgi:hypothetical protein
MAAHLLYCATRSILLCSQEAAGRLYLPQPPFFDVADHMPEFLTPPSRIPMVEQLPLPGALFPFLSLPLNWQLLSPLMASASPLLSTPAPLPTKPRPQAPTCAHPAAASRAPCTPRCRTHPTPTEPTTAEDPTATVPGLMPTAPTASEAPRIRFFFASYGDSTASVSPPFTPPLLPPAIDVLLEDADRSPPPGRLFLSLLLSIKGSRAPLPSPTYPNSPHLSSSPVHCSTPSLVAVRRRSSPEPQFVAGVTHSPSVVEPLLFSTRPNPRRTLPVARANPRLKTT